MRIQFISDHRPDTDGKTSHALWRVRNGYALAYINDAGIYRIDWCATPADAQGRVLLSERQSTRLLVRMLEGKAELAAYGTSFQCAVWQEVAKIPCRATCSYGDIARTLGKRAMRAVGNAVGKNPLYVVIPCHRVIAADGSIGGYGWGIEHKRALLASEMQARSWFVHRDIRSAQ